MVARHMLSILWLSTSETDAGSQAGAQGSFLVALRERWQPALIQRSAGVPSSSCESASNRCGDDDSSGGGADAAGTATDHPALMGSRRSGSLHGGRWEPIHPGLTVSSFHVIVAARGRRARGAPSWLVERDPTP